MVYSKAKTYSKRPTASRFSKRWYVDAQVPKAVPFIGGASFKAGSGNLTKRSIQNIIRNSVLENKQKICIDTGTLMTHNTQYTFNPLGNIPIGTGDASRVSDVIHVKNIKVRTQFQSLGIKETLLRVTWLKTNAEYLSGSDATASGLGSSEVYLNGATQLAQSILDSDKVTVLSDQIHRITHTTTNALGAAEPKQYFFDHTCPLPAGGMRMIYKSGTSNYSRDKNLYMVISSWSFGDTSGVTQHGTFASDVVINFCDGA